jgi:5-methylcytosine-specific restriction protein A
MIEKRHMLGAWFYKLDDVNDAICRESGPCQLDLLLPQTKFVAVDGFMNSKNLLPFLKWVEEGEPAHEYVSGNIARAIKDAEKLYRKKSKKYRWLIAYRQQYKCNMCRDLLHPDALDIDHCEELRDGGEDEMKNLQALCPTCHAKKTRSHGRRKRKR